MGYTPNRGKPNPSPQLTLSGKWLNKLGFTVGSHYTLTRQAGQLIIRLAEEWVSKTKLLIQLSNNFIKGIRWCLILFKISMNDVI
ncbi:SymE family type I addiction module toxin [Providencia huaxiensis]|nr:SymE family type I addiction module toxin [Providencia huaxiensis]MDI7241520.1 SymE family type I addiction module toxin [Providencia huaxiensis]